MAFDLSMGFVNVKKTNYCGVQIKIGYHCYHQPRWISKISTISDSMEFVDEAQARSSVGPPAVEQAKQMGIDELHGSLLPGIQPVEGDQTGPVFVSKTSITSNLIRNSFEESLRLLFV